MKFKSLKIKRLALLALVCGLWPSISMALYPCSEISLATNPRSQFIDNGDGTVTDTKTTLIWQKCPEGQSGTNCEIGAAQSYSWQGALQRVVSMNSSTGFANQVDWRLPNIKELLSIVEHGCNSPALHPDVFPNVAPSVNFWSSTSSAGSKANAIHFGAGITSRPEKTSLGQIRLVRSN